ncbi:MAG: hypothetical protein ACE5KX_07715 [Acidimicrobiia bacterium]
MEFTPEQHKTWAELYRRQLPLAEAHACREYLEGFELLGLPAEAIPSLEHLNSRITPATGWTVVPTSVGYSDAVEWYDQFSNKRFLISDYMRSWDELDWAPEPDLFHDIFGHLPFMMLPGYAELQEMFAPAFLATEDEEERENIKCLAWFSLEFGVVRESGGHKIFGAGLLSDGDEMLDVIDGGVPLHEFTVENVILRDKTADRKNRELFVFDSMQAVKAELARYFDPILERSRAEA